MGSGTSRGKKVAPARVSEVSVARAASGGTEARAVLRHERDRARPAGCHSDSDFSAEDDEGEAGAAEARGRKMRSRTYGLCHFGRDEAEDDFGPAPQPRASERAAGPRGSRGGSTDVNSRSNDALAHFARRTAQCPRLNNGLMLNEALLEAVPASGQQSCHHGSALTMPVIAYDGSEEELMETIEREFS